MIDDPILTRPKQEEPGILTRFLAYLANVSCFNNVPKEEMLRGGDVSKWQGKMNWNKFFDNGMNYAWIRATLNTGVDPEFERNANILTEMGKPFGVYHASSYLTTTNSLLHARHFANVVNGVGNLSLWLDSEVTNGLSPSQMARWNSDFLSELEVLIPGRIKEIYTRQTFWDFSVQAGTWSKYGLVAARYNTYLNCPWSDNRFIFRDWTDWVLWQDSADGNGLGDYYGAESNSIDTLLFNGNKELFNLRYTLEDEIVEEVMWKFEVLTNTLSYRTSPVVSNTTYVGYLTKGTVIDGIRLVNPTYDDFWIEFKINGLTYYSALTYRGTQYCKPV